MATISKPEVWQRGPIDGIQSLLQPVAHALLQADEEIQAITDEIDDEKLWTKINNLASAGFHLKHITGVLDRLFTYANGQQLDEQQLNYLSREEKSDTVSAHELAASFHEKVLACIHDLKQVDASQLSETRFVGRKKVPSSMIGLYVHAAEHIMRHVGQLLVTVRCLNNPNNV